MNRLTRTLISKFKAVLWGSLILTFVGGYFSIHLFSNLKTEIEELLPTDARSVKDVEEVRHRLESTNNLAIIIQSTNTSASKKFVVDLAQKIDQFPTDVAAGSEFKIDHVLKFFQSRKSLFIEERDLIEISKYIHKKIDYEIQLYNPLTLIGNKNIPEPRFDFEGMRKKYDSKVDAYSRFPDGYYASADEKTRLVLANLAGSANGIEGAKKLRSLVDQAILELNPTKYDSDIKIHFSGGVQDLIEEHEALIEDLALSTVVVVVLVGILMLVYFKTLTGTLALILALFVGTFWTFGLGYFQVGYLNANSAFMGSIVIGNGINYGIILLARFLEERKKRKSVIRSVALSVEKTFPATIVASLAAGLAYGSLVLTSFRGFRQFGVIGFTGMILCWIAAYTVLPALLIFFSRIGLMMKYPSPGSNYIIRKMTNWITQFPKSILTFSLVCTLFAVFSLGNISPNLIETDTTNLRNIKSKQSGSMYWSHTVDDIFGRYLSPLVALAKDSEEAKKVELALKELMEREKGKTFLVNASSIDSFVPTQQEEKISVLRNIRKKLPNHLIDELAPEQKKLSRELLATESFQTFDAQDLPEMVKAKFREKNGTIGNLVLIEPSLSEDLKKSENLIHFVQSVRAAVDSVRSGIAVAGSLPVTADMFASIVRDGPKATLFAFLSVFLLIVILFRQVKTILLCSMALWLGVLWMLGYILTSGDKINFLNFIALPITFGIGVDYGANIFQRFRTEPNVKVTDVLNETGGAVILASLTTIIGYGSLLIASNQAFVSFGRFAVLGEFTCIFAAIFTLPAFLVWKQNVETNLSKK